MPERLSFADSIWLQYHQKINDLPCHKCDKKFKLNDKVICKTSGGGGRARTYTRYYHESCWAKMLY